MPQLQLILRELEDLIPHFLFLNKIDKADKRIRDTLSFLQPARAGLLRADSDLVGGDHRPGSPISRSSGPMSTRSTPPPRSSSSPARSSAARRKGALHHAGDARRSR